MFAFYFLACCVIIIIVSKFFISSTREITEEFVFSNEQLDCYAGNADSIEWRRNEIGERMKKIHSARYAITDPNEIRILVEKERQLRLELDALRDVVMIIRDFNEERIEAEEVIKKIPEYVKLKMEIGSSGRKRVMRVNYAYEPDRYEHLYRALGVNIRGISKGCVGVRTALVWNYCKKNALNPYFEKKEYSCGPEGTCGTDSVTYLCIKVF